MLLNTSLFLLISSLYWYFKQWQEERERQLVLRSEKLEAELEANLAEQDALEAILADPATYEDAKASREAGLRFAQLQQRAEDVMSDLAYLEKELQELEAPRADG